MPYELAGNADDEKMIKIDTAPKSDVDQGLHMPDEEMRTRRRGSQLWVYIF